MLVTRLIPINTPRNTLRNISSDAATKMAAQQKAKKLQNSFLVALPLKSPYLFNDVRIELIILLLLHKLSELREPIAKVKYALFIREPLRELRTI